MLTVCRQILLIEDSDVDREAVRRALGRDIDLVEAATIAEAKAVSPDVSPDCVLLDLGLPDGQGLETLERIRETFAGVPLVVLTGLEDDELGTQALQLGAQDYLPKKRLSDVVLARAIRYAIERYRTFATIMAAEHRWRTIMESVPDVVMTTDRAGVISYVSRALGAQQPEQLVGRPVTEIFPERDDELRDAIAQVVDTGQEELFESHVPDGAGGRLWLSGRLGPFLQNGEVTGLVTVLRDVTETKALHEQVQQAQKMEAVGRLAGGVAHDFNNLLTVILGSCQHMAETLAEGDALHEEVSDVADAGHRAARLTQQLLAFSRKQAVVPERVDVTEALLGVDKMLRRTLGEKIELSVLPDDDLWPVLMDRGQLDQVLLNLAVNARDAMPDGGTLTIEAHNAPGESPGDELPHGDYVRVSMTDTGCGMTQDVKARLFEPFFTTKGEHGTGLGLSTCFGIVRQAGGHIGVRSAPGHGTTFEIALPRLQRQERAKEPAVRKPTARPPRDDGTAGTVLIVEDQPTVLRSMSRALRRAGYRILEAWSAEEALELLETHGLPDVVVTDVILRGKSGIELKHELEREHPGLGVLLTSGYLGDEVPSPVTEEGAAFLPKPFTPRELVSKVQALASQRRGRQD